MSFLAFHLSGQRTSDLSLPPTRVYVVADSALHVKCSPSRDGDQQYGPGDL
jgi:hypothetical protein